MKLAVVMGGEENLSHCDGQRGSLAAALGELQSALAKLDAWDHTSVLGARLQHVIDDLHIVIAAESGEGLAE